MSDNYTKCSRRSASCTRSWQGMSARSCAGNIRTTGGRSLMTLSDQTRDLPDDNSDYATLMSLLDLANFDLPSVRLARWNDLFKRKLSIDYRTWAKELMGVRNKLAHIGGADFSEDDTWRALDTMARRARPLTTKLPRRSAKCCASSAMAVPKLHQCHRSNRPGKDQSSAHHRHYEQNTFRSAQLAGCHRTAPGCGAGTL